MVSRANKEQRLNHSGLSISTGHGGLKRNASGPPKKVGPKDTSASGKSGWVEKVAEVLSGGSDGNTPDGGDGMAGSDAEAISQVGDAGASIAKTYKEKQAAKSSSKSSGGA